MSEAGEIHEGEMSSSGSHVRDKCRLPHRRIQEVCTEILHT